MRVYIVTCWGLGSDYIVGVYLSEAKANSAIVELTSVCGYEEETFAVESHGVEE